MSIQKSDQLPKKTNGKTIAIVGLGKTGISCARYLQKQNIPFAIMDTRPNPPGLDEFKQEFPKHDVTLGHLDRDILLQASEIMLSPGLSMHEPIWEECTEKKIPIIGDIELFARSAKAPICAITGSNGKSTVTSLVAEMAHCAEMNVRVGGNLGTPALDLIRSIEPDLYVLELSSFQLETTYSLSAMAATILNISPDHMDRYANLEEYVQAKHRIYNGSEFIIWNRDDARTTPSKKLNGVQTISFGMSEPRPQEFGIMETDAGSYLAFGDEALLSVHDMLMKGRHNWSNAIAALALGYAMNIPMPAMLQALQTFPGLPHRCQWVRNHGGVAWYNDSKGTNIGASLAALKGIGASIAGKVILIAGGQGKGANFTELYEPAKKYTRAIILMGEDTPKITQALQGATTILPVESLQQAVQQAAKCAQPGDVVLLSPACASFDMFKNFEHRGEVFMELVKEIVQ